MRLAVHKPAPSTSNGRTDSGSLGAWQPTDKEPSAHRGNSASLYCTTRFSTKWVVPRQREHSHRRPTVLPRDHCAVSSRAKTAARLKCWKDLTVSSILIFLVVQAVCGEPVSDCSSPEYREKTGNFRSFCARLAKSRVELPRKSNGLARNSLILRTGNFIRPCRELNPAIRQWIIPSREHKNR